MSASRLEAGFASHRGGTGLIPYVTAGYPSLDATLAMLRGFAAAGALAVEVGIPFSDPIADGPDIQRASEWAVRAGVGADDVLTTIARFRTECDLPVIVMTYANPILSGGADRFARAARHSGVDAVLVSDLPPDESPEVWASFDAVGLDTVMLIAPTTAESRLPLLLSRCSGFVYCLSRTGVTGSGGGFAGDLAERVARVRTRTALPIAVGFGISTGAEAAALRGTADAVVVGAAFMRRVTEDPERGAAERVASFAAELVSALG